MYEIFAGDACIHSDTSLLPSCKAVSPELSLSDNTAGTLSMTFAPGSTGHAAVQLLTPEIRVERNGKEVWSGRAISEKKDFWGNRTITCEGELGYLNDTLQPQKSYENPTVREFLSAVLEEHNSHVPAGRQFTLGAVTVTDSMVDEEAEKDEYFDDIYVYTNYETTLSCILDKLPGKLGGHLRVRKENGTRYLDYYKDYPGTSRQTIQFGQNLLDFTTSYDEAEFCTVLIPLGEQYDEGEVEGLEGYLTIEGVNGGKNYIVNGDAVDTYGWIQRVEHFDDITDEDELLEKGREFLSSIQFGTMALEVEAIDLNYADAGEDSVWLLDQVRVRSLPHGLDRHFPVTEIKIPLDEPEKATFTLGVESAQGLSARSNEAQAGLQEQVRRIPSKASILNDAEVAARALASEALAEAKSSAAQLISTAVEESNERAEALVRQARADASNALDRATKGYVTITADDNGTQALYVTDTQDISQARKLWRWNLGGLGYSSDGGRTFGTAITMDGQIVADYITAGVMNAARLKAGTLSDVDGRTSLNLETGNLVIKDSTGQKMWRWNIGGLGYSSDGGSTYGTAITMNGEIVADYITSGILKAGLIRTGVIADRNSTNYWDLDNGKFVATNAEITGTFKQYNSSGKKAIEISGNRVGLYDWGGDGGYMGALASIRNNSSNTSGVTIYTNRNNFLSIGYSDRAVTMNDNATVTAVISFDADDIENGEPPYIANTATGSLVLGSGGLTVKNGLITGISGYSSATGDVSIGPYTMTFTKGLLSGTSGHYGTNGDIGIGPFTLTYERGVLSSSSQSVSVVDGDVYVGSRTLGFTKGMLTSTSGSNGLTGDISIGVANLTFTRGMLTANSWTGSSATGSLFSSHPNGGICITNGIISQARLSCIQGTCYIKAALATKETGNDGSTTVREYTPIYFKFIDGLLAGYTGTL